MTAPLRVVDAHERRPAHPAHVLWRAGAILERAAADVRLLGFGQACGRTGFHPYGLERCVHRCVADAQRLASIDTGQPMDAAADAAMVSVQAEHLHLRLPADWNTAADMLLAVAVDMYRRAQPDAVIVRIG